MKKFYKLTFLIIISIITILNLSGCLETIDNPTLPSRGFYMGIVPSISYNQSIEDVHLQVAEYAEFIPVWASGAGATGFWDYADKLKGWWSRNVLDGLIRDNGMFPIIHFSFIDKNIDNQLILHTPENMEDATLSDQEWRNLYKKSVLDVVRITKPLYLSVGNEVNRWYEDYGNKMSNPNGFQHFVSLYEEIYDSVKNISPNTFVFCVFSREIVDENREADLEVLNLFSPDKLDILMFTSYPFALQEINQVSDISDDYYLIASSYMPDKLFGFSELGWLSLDFFGGEKGQSDFLINLLTNLTINQGINLHLFSYCWLHDLSEEDTSGLIKIDGTEKLAYDTWKQISNYNFK
jgi:hypothetical protein